MAAIKLLGISGSLRKASCSTGLLRAAKKVLPPGVELEILDISQLPLFNQDLEHDGTAPDTVIAAQDKTFGADAILFAVPENNYSVSAPLKNYIDWNSRVYGGNKTHPLQGKPCAIISTGGGAGGGRAQYHLRQIMVYVDMYPINKPEFMLPRFTFVDGKMGDSADANGDFKDEAVLPRLQPVLQALADWTRKLRGN